METRPIQSGDNVWVSPHGKPREAAPATVDLISGNGRSIAIRLHSKPSWARFRGGLLLHKDDLRIEMLLTREAVGPWIEILGGGHYEIEESRPQWQ